MRALKTLALIAIVFLPGSGCQLVPRSRNKPLDIPAKTRTEITKDTLKTRLAGKKVKFVDKEAETPPERHDETPRVGMFSPKLKILTAERPPKFEFMGKVREFRELLALFKSMGQTESITLPATESDLAYYNKQGIAVEDFEFVMSELGEYVNEFKVDFVGG